MPRSVKTTCVGFGHGRGRMMPTMESPIRGSSPGGAQRLITTTLSWAEIEWNGDWYWVDKWDGDVHHACEKISVDHTDESYPPGTWPTYYACYLRNVYDTNNDGVLNDQDAVAPVTTNH